MGSKPKFIHINCHHAIGIANQLTHDACFECVDIIFLNETHARQGSILRTPSGWTQVQSVGNRSRAALCVNILISFCFVIGHPFVTTISCG